jgi:hypothetical protein
MRGRYLFFLLFLGCGGFLGLNDADEPPPTTTPPVNINDASAQDDGRDVEAPLDAPAGVDANDGGIGGACGVGAELLLGDDFSGSTLEWGPPSNVGGTCTRLNRPPHGPALFATRMGGTTGILCQPKNWPINGTSIRTLRVEADIVFPNNASTEYTFLQLESSFGTPQLRLLINSARQAVIQTRPSANEPQWSLLSTNAPLAVPVSPDPIPVAVTLDMTGDHKITMTIGNANRSDLDHPLTFNPELMIQFGTSVDNIASANALETRIDNVRVCGTR